MELNFKPQRLAIIKRLRGITTTEIESKMREISGTTYRMNIDRWEYKYAKHPIDKVKLLAKATEVPIGFYYYENVQIYMRDLKVQIIIVDTGEEVTFNFI